MMKKIIEIRRFLIYTLYTLVIVCFQVSFPRAITFQNQIVDLMFIYVCLVSYYFGFNDGVVIGVIVGVLRDIFAAPVIKGFNDNITVLYGTGVFVMFILAVISSTIFTKFAKRKATFAIFDVVLMTFLYKLLGNILRIVVLKVFYDDTMPIDLWRIIYSSIIMQVFINAIFSIPVIIVLRFFGPYKNGEKRHLDYSELSGGDNSWLIH